MRLLSALGKFIGFASLGLGFLWADEASDWRLELLKEHGLSAETAALEKFQKEQAYTLEGFDQAIAQLASEHFKDRESAQKKIVLMGRPALPAVREKLNTDDPEVRFRLKEIVQVLEANGRWAKEDLMKQAVASLLRERQSKEAAGGVDLFVEFFNKAEPMVKNNYSRFRYVADKGGDAVVVDGVARLKNAGEERDQRLILDAKALTGKEEFPDVFHIETKLGAQPGGEGICHIGISVGNVRALFHPGYPNGAFRFERVDNKTEIKRNTNMGFNPATNKLLLMGIDVKRQDNGDVALDVTVSDGKNRFKTREVIQAAVIGKLGSISLDRSGHGGGDAMFDDFILDMQNP